MALEERNYGDDEDTDAYTHNARKFYFIKVNGSFVEPSLESKMKILKRNIEYLKEQKPLLLKKKKLLKDPSLIKYLLNLDRNLYFGNSWHVSRVQSTVKELVKWWPESINEDPKDAEDPDTELLEVESKLETLMYQWKHHLNLNVAEEKRKIRETQPLQERKEKLIKDLKDAEARTPPRKQRDYRFEDDDNYKCNLRRKLREYLTPDMRNFLEREREFDRRSVETSLVNVDSQLIAETESMMALQKDIKKQAAHYKEDIKRAKELALTKDTVALEELSCKQVDKIMSRWNSNEAFRANYKTSVAKSLRKRGLSADGRILDD